MQSTAPITDTRMSRPRVTAPKTTRMKLRRAATATSTTERRTYTHVGAWARHARAANGFGDGAID